MAETSHTINEQHSLLMENRTRMRITGVTAVLSYDDTGACVDTVSGRLSIGGSGLNVSELSVQSGEVRISGEIEFVQYQQAQAKRVPFWKRLLR